MKAIVATDLNGILHVSQRVYSNTLKAYGKSVYVQNFIWNLIAKEV